MKKTASTWIWVILALMLTVLVLRYAGDAAPPTPEAPYSQFKSWLKKDLVSEVDLRGREAVARLKEATQVDERQPPSESFRIFLPETDDPTLLPLLEEKGVTIRSAPESGATGWLLGLLPWIFLFGLYFWFWNRMQQNVTGRFGGRSPTDFLAGSAKQERKAKRRVTFDDVAGQDNAKREIAELVDFLRDPERYRKLGAEPPRGVLLMGPPGTGKTLLARALAGEADVNFFHTSASEFIELYVGVGASRVRQMFDEAKKRAPAIIFIDELDAVGRVRGTGLGGGNDEREQTLNQILAELDGFSGHEAVVVLAATNRPDVLDPALLRPGRFDRHVTLELPDRAARKAIVEVHTREVPLADDVDLEVIAAATPGFSGADLKNLVNEAAMAAARENARAVTMAHFDAMRDKLIMGTLRTLAIRPEERHRLAVHESGHTAVAHYLPKADPLYKVTIIPRGRSLGGTHMIPDEERQTLPEDYLADQIAVLLGGRTAENLFLGTVSSGADDDIRKASQLARAMVARWGMSPEIGPVDLRQSEEHPFLGREIAQPRRFSETTAHSVDEAVRKILSEAENRAREVIDAHRRQIERLIEKLEDRETLSKSEIESCLGPHLEVASAGV
jgi:cell division protease FtsH